MNKQEFEDAKHKANTIVVDKTELSMGYKEISHILPHAYPFLLIDRVQSCIPAEKSIAYKNVSINEPFFQGHFPGQPIMPGVLQIEALAQLCCLTMLAVPEYKAEGFIGVLAGLDNVKYRRMVVPGDRLDLEATKSKFRFPFGKFEVKASVDGEVTASGCISFAMVKSNEIFKD
jgi:3-hydroxyacyl-[acyl-carrier-protein] dehydratase